MYEQERQLRALQLEAVKQLYQDVKSLQKWKDDVLASQESRRSTTLLLETQPKINLTGAEQLLATLERSRYNLFSHVHDVDKCSENDPLANQR